jgi:hypothetical protein
MKTLTLLQSTTGGVLLLFFCFGATAAPPPGPCFQERQTICKDVKPGAGKMEECLNNNMDKLSPACREHVQKMTVLWQSFNDACKDDLKQFCPQVKPGQGRGIGCLKGNMDKLSADCQKALSSLD